MPQESQIADRRRLRITTSLATLLLAAVCAAIVGLGLYQGA